MQDTIYVRRSIRQFTNQIVSEDIIKKIIEAGICAPSARNQQPWEFIVVDDANLLAKISENGSPLYKLCNKAIILCINNTNLKTPLMVSQDMSACCQNMLLKATELGVGSCWIGTYPHPDRMENIRNCLNIPAHLEPFCGIVLGYPAKEGAFEPISRQAIVHHNQF